MIKPFIDRLRSRMRKVSFWVYTFVIACSGLTPFLLSGSAGAAQLTSRKVTITSSKASQTGVNYAFAFTLPTTTAVQSIRFEFCTNPLGTCTKPTGMDINYTLTSLNATQTFSEVTAFTEYTGVDAGACDDHNNATPANSTEYCVTRTDVDAETAAAKAIQIDNITNPSTTSVDDLYVRVSLYSDAAFATEVHNGTVAAAIVQQLTVNGRVQERLEFCVAAIDDGGATDTTLFASCSAVPGTTTIDIGIIDNSSIARSPVNDSGTNGANDDYGVAMVNTNASNGVVITFFAEPDTGGTNQLRNFRVDNATCDVTDTVVTDQCFRPAAGDGTGGTAFSAGSERFGMHIPCIDTSQGTTANLTADTDFDNADANTTHDVDCENDDAGNTFAWNDTATATTIASSSGSAVKVVDDEIIKLRFGATAQATTPTGSYTVVTTYIATPTF